MLETNEKDALKDALERIKEASKVRRANCFYELIPIKEATKNSRDPGLFDHRTGTMISHEKDEALRILKSEAYFVQVHPIDTPKLPTGSRIISVWEMGIMHPIRQPYYQCITAKALYISSNKPREDFTVFFNHGNKHVLAIYLCGYINKERQVQMFNPFPNHAKIIDASTTDVSSFLCTKEAKG